MREGELWRLVTWPLVNPPTQIWVVLTLVFFWFFGHRVEDQVGRKRFTWLILAMTVLPALLVSSIDFGGDNPYAYGLSILGTALLVIFALDNPSAMFFFNIPAWIIALVFVGIDVLSLTGARAWNQLFLELFVHRRRAGRRPPVRHARGAPLDPADRRQPSAARTCRPRPGGRSAASRCRPRRRRSSPARGAPSSEQTTDQIELDMLLDKISASGMASLSRQEKQRLNELSKRLRGS